jgi:hypothetical protein
MSELVTYWREMAKAWEEQANRNAMRRAEMEQELSGARALIEELQKDLQIAYRRKRRAA